MLLSFDSYSSTSASGTNALTTVWSSSVSVPLMRPRRLLMSPMTSPIVSLGTVTWSFTIGSRSTGPALAAASLKALRPATWKAASEESTSWYLPSRRRTLRSTTG